MLVTLEPRRKEIKKMEPARRKAKVALVVMRTHRRRLSTLVLMHRNKVLLYDLEIILSVLPPL